MYTNFLLGLDFSVFTNNPSFSYYVYFQAHTTKIYLSLVSGRVLNIALCFCLWDHKYETDYTALA